MGQIWRAEHLILKAPVAVKLVDREAIPDDETLSRFIREAQAAAAIRSPHVVQILDYGTEDKVPYMVMELLDGETLAQRLKREKRLPPQETARLVTHIARAVGRAHEEGIVHRDLKPENVFIVKNDDEEVAKVLDFGVAKVESASLGDGATKTRTGSILGTPYYMSPEQAQGNKAVDFRSDLWSLAVIAFECLTGRRPFYSDGLGDLVLQICIRDIPVPSRVAPVPLGFDAWFRKGTERDPDKRYQSAREMVESLREVLGVEPRETWGGPDVLVTTGGQSNPPPSTSPSSRSEAVTELASVSQFPEPDSAAPQASSNQADAAAESRRPPPARMSAAGSSLAQARALLNEDQAQALTVQQFGTTKHSSPPPPGRSSSGILWVVAGGALAIGAVIGFAVVSRGELSGGGEERAETPGSLTPEQRQSAMPKARRTDSMASIPSSSAGAPAPEAASAVHDAGAEAEAPKDAAVVDAAVEPGAADAGEHEADAGADAWVKPEWARPDDEEEEEVYSAPPVVPPSPKSGVQDNPY